MRRTSTELNASYWRIPAGSKSAPHGRTKCGRSPEGRYQTAKRKRHARMGEAITRSMRTRSIVVIDPSGKPQGKRHIVIEAPAVSGPCRRSSSDLCANIGELKSRPTKIGTWEGASKTQRVAAQQDVRSHTRRARGRQLVASGPEHPRCKVQGLEEVGFVAVGAVVTRPSSWASRGL